MPMRRSQEPWLTWILMDLLALSPAELLNFSTLMNAQPKIFVGGEIPLPKRLAMDTVSCAFTQHLCFPTTM